MWIWSYPQCAVTILPSILPTNYFIFNLWYWNRPFGLYPPINKEIDLFYLLPTVTIIFNPTKGGTITRMKRRIPPMNTIVQHTNHYTLINKIYPITSSPFNPLTMPNNNPVILFTFRIAIITIKISLRPYLYLTKYPTISTDQ